MKLDTKQIITVTEANQNFSKATRIADEYGDAVVFKNNRPKLPRGSLRASSLRS